MDYISCHNVFLVQLLFLIQSNFSDQVYLLEIQLLEM